MDVLDEELIFFPSFTPFGILLVDQEQTRLMTKFFTGIFILLAFSSCKPQKAVEFRDAIARQERIAFSILTGKGGPNEEKLNFLVKEDFKGALAAINKVELAFNEIIYNIENLPAENLDKGKELKTAALDYYKALKILQVSEKAEIKQQEITHGKDPDKVQIALDSSLQLKRENQKLYTILYKKEAALDWALKEFNAANGL